MLDDFAAAAEAAADAAAGVIRPLFRRALTADAKTDDSPVTIADRNAERAIRDVLERAFPTHGILGEEHGTVRPDARFRWVIDPIDGTRAFITGRPTFGVLIALLDGDRPILGVLDQPVTRERWVGMAGRPTRFFGPMGGKVGVRSCAGIGQAELSCTAPDMVAGDAAAGWDNLAKAVRRVSWGGDCYAYGLLALGQIDLVAEGTLKLWDWAALLPIVEGAGGRMTDWRGAPLTADGDGQVLAVGDSRILELAVELLTK
jgi:myo-inositol-1(or 4)-monophosphatase